MHWRHLQDAPRTPHGTGQQRVPARADGVRPEEACACGIGFKSTEANGVFLESWTTRSENTSEDPGLSRTRVLTPWTLERSLPDLHGLLHSRVRLEGGWRLVGQNTVASSVRHCRPVGCGPWSPGGDPRGPTPGRKPHPRRVSLGATSVGRGAGRAGRRRGVRGGAGKPLPGRPEAQCLRPGRAQDSVLTPKGTFESGPVDCPSSATLLPFPPRRLATLPQTDLRLWKRSGEGDRGKEARGEAQEDVPHGDRSSPRRPRSPGRPLSGAVLATRGEGEGPGDRVCATEPTAPQGSTPAASVSPGVVRSAETRSLGLTRSRGSPACTASPGRSICRRQSRPLLGATPPAGCGQVGGRGDQARTVVGTE